MGTPEFAVSSLKILLQNDFPVKAVVTATDKPAGRGNKIQFSDVKKFAIENNLHVLQPDNLKSPEFIEQLREINADLFIVVAFRMLPKQVWEMPKLGTFNLHASLLPDYRGAAPINHALINGDNNTGVTTFFINEEIDKGNIIFREETQILPTDNAGSLHDRLMEVGSKLVLKTVDAIQNQSVVLHSQDEFGGDMRPAPKIFKDFCRIDWSKPGIVVQNHVRGLSPYPAAWTILLNDLQVKIFKTNFVSDNHNMPIGSIITDNKKFMKVAVCDGYIEVLEIQLQGRKRMLIVELLNGFDFEDSSCFI
ncbi:MAG: methionyl-tRNA formyltransferase [Bacteroidales bacterium]|nr:methionyl-tRNA formyltransferase [Bacteroidales bacterium]